MLVRISENGIITFYGTEAGLDVVGIRAICQDAASRLLLGTDRGVYAMDDSETIRLLDDDRLKSCYVNQMSQDASGTVYGSDYDGNVFVIRDLRVVCYLESTLVPVRSVFGDLLHENWVYIGTTGSETLHGCQSRQRLMN